MAIQYIRESSLKTSEIFTKFNASVGNKILENAISLAKTSKQLSSNDIEMAYISVRQISDTLTRAGIKAFDSGQVILLYNEDSTKSMTQALPFITFKQGNSHVTYLFGDKYITRNKQGVLTISASIFRDLLIGGVLANGIKRNYNAMASNQYLAKILMDVYSKLFVRVLNREFSLGADKKIMDILQYWTNRFFLERVYETTDNATNIDTLASKHYKYLDEMTAIETKNKYDSADVQTISDLITVLKTVSHRMDSMHLGSFLNAWINYYFPPSMLAIDTIEYYTFMVMTLLSGNNIINIAASDAVKESKNIKNLRPELEKLIVK